MRYLSPPLFPVRLSELPCRLHLHEMPSADFEVGEFRISSALICHPGPTVGYRIANAGATLAYVMDHEPALGAQEFPLDAEWTSGYALAAGADLLIHDAQYSDAEYARCVGWGHSSMRHAIAFAALAAVKHVVLFHHDPAHADHDIERLTAEAIAAAQPACTVTPGAEGDVFELR